MEYLFFGVKMLVVVWFAVMLTFIHDAHRWSKDQEVQNDEMGRSIQMSAKFAFRTGLVVLFLFSAFQFSDHLTTWLGEIVWL
ncbi:hypothetical protein RYZ26_08395 [Terasakiella sp. A23]|uniref:hypothetical protein n=1 Tax=Terasakiella sp. FCG-A23 TaxID=3080561 RepID=UPI002953DDF4|nr:hypothetical protein [Terasakiella sp. A23]MDV7339608.1 hypothetical protein [Terasakiella sp. A23]